MAWRYIALRAAAGGTKKVENHARAVSPGRVGTVRAMAATVLLAACSAGGGTIGGGMSNSRRLVQELWNSCSVLRDEAAQGWELEAALAQFTGLAASLPTETEEA